MAKHYTARELAELAKAEKHGRVRYAYSTNGTTVAAWWGNRWVPVAGLIADGRFASMPYEILVNGERPSDRLTFREV